MSRAARLGAYLREAAGRAVAWGEFDCAVGFTSRWVEAERGVDPAASYRGLYGTPLAAARLLRAQGGLARGLSILAARQAAEAGLEPTDAPGLGDVGLVWAQGRRRLVQTLALRGANRWALLAPRGLAFGDAVLIQAWRV